MRIPRRMTAPEDPAQLRSLGGMALVAAITGRDDELAGLLGQICAGGPAWVQAATCGWAAVTLTNLTGQPAPVPGDDTALLAAMVQIAALVAQEHVDGLRPGS